MTFADASGYSVTKNLRFKLFANSEEKKERVNILKNK